MPDMLDLQSPTNRGRNANLDSPPPQPPARKGGDQFMPPPPAPEGGIGDMANSPEIMTMQGLAMAKDAFQLIANGMPMLAQLLSNTINELEQLVAQATAETMAGGQPAVTAPPGVAPMAPPPPGVPPGAGGPPQGGPGIPPGM